MALTKADKEFLELTISKKLDPLQNHLDRIDQLLVGVNGNKGVIGNVDYLMAQDVKSQVSRGKLAVIGTILMGLASAVGAGVTKLLTK